MAHINLMVLEISQSTPLKLTYPILPGLTINDEVRLTHAILARRV